jgi:hypothetical protein
MNVAMILASAQLAGMVLSISFLLRVRRLSAGIWSISPTYQLSLAESDVKQPSEVEQIFRA